MREKLKDPIRILILECDWLRENRIIEWLRIEVGFGNFWTDRASYVSYSNTSPLIIAFYYQDDLMRFKLMGF